MDPALTLLAHQIRTNFHGKAWQGPTLWGSLRGLDHEFASRRPAPGRKCIWDQVLHAAYWKYTVARRLTGADTGSFPRSPSNWPRRSAGDAPKAWAADKALLKAQHDALVAAVESLDVRDLNSPVPGSTGLSHLALLSGIAAHDAYHTGQINLIKAMFGR